MKTIQTISAFILIAGAVSCSRDALSGAVGPVGASGGLLALRPSGDDVTKAYVDSTELPDTYTIVLSAFRSVEDGSAESGNYFTGVPFNCEGDGVWHASPKKYWPFGGMLDFLGIASEMDLTLAMTWGDRRNTDGVSVDVPSGNSGESEVLYSFVDPCVVKPDSAVVMAFHHTQALLEFNFKSELDNIVRLDSIIVEDSYTGGRLIVQQHPLSLVKWDTDDIDMRDVPVPGVNGNMALIKGKDRSFRVAVLPRSGRHFTVHMRQRPNTGASWSRAVDVSYEYDEPSLKWRAGYKYIYNFNINSSEIEFTASTTILGSGDGDVVYVD